MKAWDELSDNARYFMRDLGNFGPTFHAENREVKGYMLDPEGDAGKVYYTSNDLRQMASAAVEVADWLDERAAEPKT